MRINRRNWRGEKTKRAWLGRALTSVQMTAKDLASNRWEGVERELSVSS
jgi:hypothetical protein